MKKVLVSLLLMGMSFVSYAKDKEEESSKLDEILSSAVQKGVELAEKTGHFVIEQAPDLLQQFYKWHIASAIFWIIFSIVFFILGRYLPYTWLSKDETSYYERFFGRYGDDGVMGAYVLFVISAVASSIILLGNVYDLVFMLVAPKLYLIEYFIK